MSLYKLPVHKCYEPQNNPFTNRTILNPPALQANKPRGVTH